jgi:hypothetical protein
MNRIKDIEVLKEIIRLENAKATLLEALEDIVSLVKDSYGDCPEDDQIFHVAIRAIAKAKGG